MPCKKVLVAASVASMIDQFNIPNIRLLQEMGYEVHVACNFKEGNTCDTKRICRLYRMLRRMHVVQHQWDCPRSPCHAAGCIRAYRQLLELVKKYTYEWVHCHSPVGGALTRMVAWRTGIQVIYTAHGFHFYKGAPLRNWLLYYPAEKLLSYVTDVLVTVNKEDYRFAEQTMRAGNVCYIPGVGIDTQRFRIEQILKSAGISMEKAELRTTQNNLDRRKERLRHDLRVRFGIPEHAAVLLSVGELNKGKNHQIVINALAQISRQDVYYLICGQGGLREQLRKNADRLGVGSRVRMPGFCEEMPLIYQGADIFVFPSLREGMPAALMEAMAAGMPCIVSDIRGNRELVGMTAEDGTKLRFMPNRPMQLKKIIEKLLDNSQLRKDCGIKNQRKMYSYDIAVVNKKMRNIYLSLERI